MEEPLSFSPPVGLHSQNLVLLAQPDQLRAFVRGQAFVVLIVDLGLLDPIPERGARNTEAFSNGNFRVTGLTPPLNGTGLYSSVNLDGLLGSHLNLPPGDNA